MTNLIPHQGCRLVLRKIPINVLLEQVPGTNYSFKLASSWNNLHHLSSWKQLKFQETSSWKQVLEPTQIPGNKFRWNRSWKQVLETGPGNRSWNRSWNSSWKQLKFLAQRARVFLETIQVPGKNLSYWKKIEVLGNSWCSWTHFKSLSFLFTVKAGDKGLSGCETKLKGLGDLWILAPVPKICESYHCPFRAMWINPKVHSKNVLLRIIINLQVNNVCVLYAHWPIKSVL